MLTRDHDGRRAYRYEALEFFRPNDPAVYTPTYTLDNPRDHAIGLHGHINASGLACLQCSTAAGRSMVTRRHLLIRVVLHALWLLGCLLLASGPACAAALEASRGQITVTVERNAITVDNDVKYVRYEVGERIQITLEYSATCDIVFNGLGPFRARPFTPMAVTGQIGNVSGTPRPGRAAAAGNVTFDTQFTRLGATPDGAQSGLARLDLVLGVDKDCNLATGDPDGVDRTTTIRVLISVSTNAQ